MTISKICLGIAYDNYNRLKNTEGLNRLVNIALTALQSTPAIVSATLLFESKKLSLKTYFAYSLCVPCAYFTHRYLASVCSEKSKSPLDTNSLKSRNKALKEKIIGAQRIKLPGRHTKEYDIRMLQEADESGLTKKSSCIDESEQLYLGNWEACREACENPSQVDTLIITVASIHPFETEIEFCKIKQKPNNVEHLFLNVQDQVSDCYDQLTNEINRTNAFAVLDTARKEKKKILIHCSKGISRSPSFLAAYLIDRCHVSANEALHFLKTKRLIVNPYHVFESGLRKSS